MAAFAKSWRFSAHHVRMLGTRPGPQPLTCITVSGSASGVGG
jgi:hypothetical protein